MNTDHVFLTSALVERQFPALRPGRFTPEEKAPGTHCIGGRMGPRTGLEEVERKYLVHTNTRNSNSRPSNT
jgi:hypothetical protein